MATTTDPLSLLTTDSAILPDVAAERGYRHLTADEAKAELTALGFEPYQVTGGGLLVPMFGTDGSNGACQFRPDAPRLRDEKPIKYESPAGARNMLDVHPRMTQHLASPASDLFIVEGVKKADSLTSLNFVTIAISGVWNWRSKTGALGDFEGIALHGRKVFLVFDSDARTNPNVRLALDRLAEFLRSRGATVRLVLPPDGPGGAKQGVDDYLASGGTVADLLALPENAERQDGDLFDSWEAIDLSALGERDPLLPDLAPELPIFYPGKRHVISGPPESLKTLLTYLGLLLSLRNGKRVGVINFEMDEFDARDMFRDLGATDEELAQIVFRSPERAPIAKDIAAMAEERLDEVLIDAGAGMYDLEGADDNQRVQVEAAARKWIRPLWKAGTATFLLDHEPKRGGSWVIGSERKVGQADVHLRFESKVTLTRGGRGVVRVTVEKDRPGFIRRETPHGFEVHVLSEPITNSLKYAIKVLSEDDVDDFRPTALMEKVSREVERESGRSKTKVASKVGGKKEWVLKAMDVLDDEGFIRIEQKGQGHYLHHVQPFREDDEIFGSEDGQPTTRPMDVPEDF